jgi:hypothetical protein
MLAAFIGYCCKKTDFDDDHVFQEEELPTIFYNPDDPPSIGKRGRVDEYAKAKLLTVRPDLAKFGHWANDYPNSYRQTRNTF